MGRINREFDVIILGAGPAGSSAAIRLAGAGRCVLLVDKQRFPRDKVCGGCLSGTATSRIKSVFGEQGLTGTPASTITFVAGQRRIGCDARGATRLVLRAELDHRLAKLAWEAGAHLRFGEPAWVEEGPSGWDVVTGGDRLRAPLILLACGAGRALRALGIRGRRGRGGMIGQQWVQPASTTLPRPGCAELHWLDGGYVGLATLDKDRCIVALASELEKPAMEGAFRQLRRLNPRSAVWESLPGDAPQQFGAKGTAGFPWFPRQLGKENVLLVGDAAGFAEPFTGEGIGQAILSAECACLAVLEGRHILRRYTYLMHRHRHVLWRTRALGWALGTAAVRLLGKASCQRRAEEAEEGGVSRFLSKIVERIHIRGSE